MLRCARLVSTASLLALAMLSVGCAHWHIRSEAHNPLATWVPSKNHNERKAVLIVIHATQQQSAQASLKTLRGSNVNGPVSAHYLVGRDGKRYQLVAEERRAWHAGGGRWGTITDLNSASIGIELDNDGASDFSDAQIDSLLVLLADLCQRLEIPREQVIGHADLAPARKTDPGARFPWAKLAAAGFGRWPDPALLPAPIPPGFDGWAALRVLGYRVREPQAALRAFRLHFRGIDDEQSPLGNEDLHLLYALVATGPDAVFRADSPPAPEH